MLVAKCLVQCLALPKGYFLPPFPPPICLSTVTGELPWGMQGGAAASAARGSVPAMVGTLGFGEGARRGRLWVPLTLGVPGGY